MRISRFLTALMLACLLAGCAAQSAFDNGQALYASGKVEQGLAEMNRAYQLDPDNSEYRSQYYKHREVAVYRWLALAEAAKKKEAWDDAGNYYRRILKIDPDNPRAKTGLSDLNTDKKQAQLLDEAKELIGKNDLRGASRKVRKVLAESPSKPEALRLQKLIDGKLAAANRSGSILKSKLRRPITIEFKDAPIRAVFDSISQVAGINFIFDKEVRPDLRTSLFVRDARIDDVIRFLLVTNELGDRMLNSNTLFIYPNTPSKQKQFQELQVKNFYLTNARAKDVAAMLKTMVKPKDMYVDDKLNLIVMRDTPDTIRVAERLVAAQDMAEPEVMLEVEVLEVGTNLLDNLGIQYPSKASATIVGAAGTPGTATLSEILNRNSGLVQVSLSDPALAINLLHQDGDTNLLANPRIRVKNHEKANIMIGDKVPVITNTTTATGLVSQSINYLDVGLKLNVQPTIYLDNEVGINVGLEVSSITKEIQQKDGSLVYQIGTRNASTVLRLKDGETQILAGLINKEDRKTASSIPGLGQLPIIGRLFSNNTDSSTKTEVVLLITPHVVRNIVPPESPVEEFMSGTESDISLDQMEINQADAADSATASDTRAASAGAQAALPPVPQSQASGNSAANTDKKVQPAPPAASVAPAPLGSVQLALDVPAKAAAGKPFSVSVNLDAKGLQNAMLNLAFDPAKLKVVHVTEGDVLKGSDGKTRFMQQVQDKTGRVSLSVMRKGNVQGKGTLASVTFQPLRKTSGKTELRVEAANFSDSSGRVLPINALPIATLNISK